MRHPRPRITGPFGPRRTRWASAANVATQREYRHRASSGTIFGASQQTEHAGEEQRAVDEEDHVAITAERGEARRKSRMTNPSAIKDPLLRPIDHHARHRVAPVTAEPNQEPGTHPLARHTRQDLGEEHSRWPSRQSWQYASSALARRERIQDIAPAQRHKRDLQHGHQRRRMRPSESPGAEWQPNLRADRFAARRTKSTRRSRGAWPRRSRSF